MSDVYLTYVGKKPFAIDSIGGTGVVWNGNGDVQPVPEAVAEKLLKYPDQWVSTPKATKVTKATKAEAEAAAQAEANAAAAAQLPAADTTEPDFAA